MATKDNLLDALVMVTLDLSREKYVRAVNELPRFTDDVIGKRSAQLAAEKKKLTTLLPPFGCRPVQGKFRICRSPRKGTKNVLEFCVEKDGRKHNFMRKFRAPPIHKINLSDEEKTSALDHAMPGLIEEIGRSLK